MHQNEDKIINKKQKWKEYLQKKKAERQSKLRHEFLPEALEIVEKPASPLGHFVIFATSAAILFALIWAFCGRVDEVVSARGKIITVSGIQNIQTVNGGIVEEILVKEGDYVTAGQTIMLLDASVYEITLNSSKESLKLLEFENTLLDEALNGKRIATYLSNEGDAGEQKVIQYVLALQEEFETKKEELETAMEQAEAQIEIEGTNLKKLKKNKQFLEEQKETLKTLAAYSNTEELSADKLALSVSYKEKELKDYQELYNEGVISKAELENCKQELELLRKDYELQKDRKVYEDFDNSIRMVEIDNQLIMAGEDCTLQEQAVELTKRQYEQTVNNMNTLEADFKTKISNLIVENEEKIRSQKSNEEIQTVELSEQKIVSPVNGILKTLEIETEGGVLTPAQIVATVVPEENTMQAEVDVLNQDIGYIQTGQEITMKLDTFNFQKYGKLNGCVVSISPDAVFDERKGWIYKVKLAVDDKEFKERALEFDIGIGMEGTAEIKVSDRRIIDFFLEPIMEHFDGSLKVR